MPYPQRMTSFQGAVDGFASRAAFDRPKSSVAVGGGTTARERALLSFFVLWVGFGLAIDSRKHNTEADLDTFFTPAHGLLYAGWFACAMYLLYIARKRMHGGVTGLAAIPQGLRGATAGALLFGVSGLGDMGWHVKWGVEENTAILFSPTHLGLMASFLLLAFGPFRALWMERQEVTLVDMLPAAFSLGVVGTIFSVFLGYNSPITPLVDGGIFTTAAPVPIPDLAQVFVLYSVSGCLIFTAALIGPLLILLRRWDMPFGTATVAFSITALCVLISVDFGMKTNLAALAGAGVIIDVLWQVLRRFPERRVAYRVFGFLSPLALWGTYLVFTIQGNSIIWEREFWTGTLLWTALIGLGLSAVLLPPKETPIGHLD